MDMSFFTTFAKDYVSIVILTLIASKAVVCSFTYWLVKQKKKEVATWIFLSFIFGLIAFLALGFAPEDSSKQDR